VSEGGLRDICIREMTVRGTPGYAIGVSCTARALMVLSMFMTGGLAGGEEKELFWRVVAHVNSHCPNIGRLTYSSMVAWVQIRSGV
jgi:queuine/archaeosine tRNA-ribosyltransferase